MKWFLATLSAVTLLGSALGQNNTAPTFPFPTSCSGVSAPRFPYTLNSAWRLTKLLGGLRTPRSIVFDPQGHMIVLEATSGISVHTFGSNGCISSSKSLVQNSGLNHGISLTPDGRTLYASTQTQAFAWTYDPVAMTVTGQRTVITGMSTGLHTTRTILVSPVNPNLVLVSVGSNSNVDLPTSNPATGRSIIKVFDMSAVPANGYQYNTQGTVLGYGLRNSVALAFDPNGHAWASENSGDSMTRNGQDIHVDNPAEELNYLGNPASPPQNTWFGYPTCYAVWEPAPFNGQLRTGDQFVSSVSGNQNDANCASQAVGPRLSFMAHMAPITNAFDPRGANLYTTFHGSWNRQPASGYKLLEIPFRQLESGNYDPVAARDARDFGVDVLAAQNVGNCQSSGLTQSTCFRLAGLAWDQAGTRLFVSSDNASEGEIYVLQKTALE
jgi:glucose/arabinose dehydrogenase